MTNFKLRYIKVVLGIGEGQMGDKTPPEYWTLTDHRVSVHIQNYGGETQGSANVKIYGMTVSDMNKLTAIGPVMYQLRSKNTIQILAGDDPNSLSSIYFGVIQEAYADFNNAPDVYLNVSAQSASIAALGTAIAYTKKGPTPVSLIMSTLASNLKWQFQNLDIGAGNMNVGGLDFMITDPVGKGSYLEQIKQFADTADIDWYQESKTITSVLKIKHRFSVFPEDANPIVSPDTNMIGYPTFSQSNMTVRTMFMPTASLGGKLVVKGSLIVPANGKWIIHSVVHDLDTLLPSGKWQTTCGVMPS